jgi:hypothetical protein
MSTVPNSAPSPAKRRWRPHLSARVRRITKRILATLLVVWIVFVGLIFWAMNQPPEKFGSVMKHMPWPVFLVLPFETLWNHARGGTLHVGDAAPDFTLTKLDKTGTVQLSELSKRQPVVMVFGSYT